MSVINIISKIVIYWRTIQSWIYFLWIRWINVTGRHSKCHTQLLYSPYAGVILSPNLTGRPSGCSYPDVHCPYVSPHLQPQTLSLVSYREYVDKLIFSAAICLHSYLSKQRPLHTHMSFDWPRDIQQLPE